MNGAVALCDRLERMGARAVFGVVGTQNLELYDALRRSSIRTVTATHELAAGFMANGYARATGRAGVLVTIPGPGLAYALPALSEARCDSVPLVHVVTRAEDASPATSIVKRVFRIEASKEIARVVREAYETAHAGEPGPVLVEIARAALTESEPQTPESPTASVSNDPRFDEALTLLAASRRVAFFVGQGALEGADDLRGLAEQLAAPVVMATSGRGALPEDHPLAWPIDALGGHVDELNRRLASCDLVVVLGCKLGSNATGGSRVKLPPNALLRVDASDEVLAAGPAAKLSIRADAAAFLAAARRRIGDRRETSGAAPRGAVAADPWEPRFPDLRSRDVADFFAALRRAMPRGAILALDSGQHQLSARRHFPVLAPRTLLAPTNFQSMGFAIAAAAGAKVAHPKRAAVALLGDGGFAMTGLELLALAREGIRLTVVVFNDGQWGLIRRKQLGESLAAFGTDLRNPDFELLARSLGVGFVRLRGDAEPALREAISSDRTTLVEVRVSDSLHSRKARAKGAARRAIGRVAARLRGR